MPSKKLEKHIENACIRHALERGWTHVKLDKAKRNWPDQLFLGPGGSVLLVEFKRPGEKPRPAQKRVHRLLAEIGHRVHVIDSADDFVDLLGGGA
jgi:hypothetical protein